MRLTHHDIDTLQGMDSGAITDPTDQQLHDTVLRRVQAEQQTQARPQARSSHRRRLSFAIAIPVAACLAAGAYFTVDALQPRSQALLAAPSAESLSTWVAVPTPVLDPTDARRSCLSSFGADLGDSPDATWILEEQRGDVTSMIATYRDESRPADAPEQMGFCIVAPDSTGLWDGLLPEVRVRPATGITVANGGGDLDGPEDERIQYVTGRAAPDVATIELALSDGRTVQASLKDGWYAAWWNGAALTSDTDLIWTTTSGETSTAPFESVPYYGGTE
jgi:hypothetical protein